MHNAILDGSFMPIVELLAISSGKLLFNSQLSHTKDLKIGNIYLRLALSLKASCTYEWGYIMFRINSSFRRGVYLDL